MLAGVGAKLGPSWIQVGSKLRQVGTKIGPNEPINRLYTFLRLPRGVRNPPTWLVEGKSKGWVGGRGANKDGPGVDPAHIFDKISERFR